MPSTNALNHWNEEAAQYRARVCQTWLRFMTETHDELIVRCARELPDGALILKTDLFEEAVAEDHPLGRIAIHGWRTAGMDVNPRLAAAARRHLKAAGRETKRLFSGDVRHVPLRDDCLDAVFSNSTLDHFPRRDDLGAAFRELRRCLKPGGLLILTLDNPWNPLVGVRNAMPRKLTDALRITPYYVGYTCGLRAARRMLSEAGFDIEAGGALAHAQRFIAIHTLRRLERRGASGLCERILAFCHWQERVLRRLPTAQLTGHFIWVKARKTTLGPRLSPAPGVEYPLPQNRRPARRWFFGLSSRSRGEFP